MIRWTGRKLRHTTTLRLGCALASALPFAQAFGAWDTVSDITMGVEANDNPRLGQRNVDQTDELTQERDHTSVRALMDARFRLSNFGERGQIYLQPRLRADTYADSVDSDLQRQDGYLYSRGAYKWQRGDAGFNANFSRESILSSEIIDTGLGDLGVDLNGNGVIEPVEGTGQLVELDERRNRVSLAPFANFTLSSRSTIGIEASYLDVTYTGAEIQGRSDISERLFGTHITRTIDERTGATARVYVSDFTGETTDNETRTVGVEGSFNRHLSEIWSFVFGVGLERSEFSFRTLDNGAVDNADANFTMNLGFTKQTDLSSLDFILRRASDPSASGFLTERDEIQIIYRHQMSERLTVNFGLRALQERALNHSERASGRDVARLSFDIDWAFTPSWSIAFGVDALSQRFVDRLRADGNANVLSVGVIYRGRSRQQAQQR
jgi:hypothetical protein